MCGLISSSDVVVNSSSPCFFGMWMPDTSGPGRETFVPSDHVHPVNSVVGAFGFVWPMLPAKDPRCVCFPSGRCARRCSRESGDIYYLEENSPLRGACLETAEMTVLHVARWCAQRESFQHRTRARRRDITEQHTHIRFSSRLLFLHAPRPAALPRNTATRTAVSERNLRGEAASQATEAGGANAQAADSSTSKSVSTPLLQLERAGNATLAALSLPTRPVPFAAKPAQPQPPVRVDVPRSPRMDRLVQRLFETRSLPSQGQE